MARTTITPTTAPGAYGYASAAAVWVELPVYYKDTLVGVYKADLIIDHKIIIEIKGISRLNSSHDAQALHYLAATGMELAILINFGSSTLEYRRVVRSEKKESTTSK